MTVVRIGRLPKLEDGDVPIVFVVSGEDSDDTTSYAYVLLFVNGMVARIFSSGSAWRNKDRLPTNCLMLLSFSTSRGSVGACAVHGVYGGGGGGDDDLSSGSREEPVPSVLLC